jgi:enoyl-[acyl-carrier-protein] reductase (NADH)
MNVEEFTRAAAAQIPLRRAGHPEEVAHAVSFLASENAGFISAQVIDVAGGPDLLTGELPAGPSPVRQGSHAAR